MTEAVFTGITMGICALVMFGIGIMQLKSKEPVGFYTGEKPPSREQLTDVDSWNKKHGIMWILYGACIIATFLCGLGFQKEPILAAIYCVGLLVPIPLMILYHHKLRKTYLKKGQD